MASRTAESTSTPEQHRRPRSHTLNHFSRGNRPAGQSLNAEMLLKKYWSEAVKQAAICSATRSLGNSRTVVEETETRTVNGSTQPALINAFYNPKFYRDEGNLG